MPVLLVKQRINDFEPPFGVELTGTVCDLYLASWKVPSPLLTGYNCILSLALTAEALIRRNRPLLMVNLGLNIRLKGYVYRQHIYTVRYGNGSTTILLLEVFT